MTSAADPLAERYRRALRRYLEGAGEAALAEAYQVGRAAMARGEGVLDAAKRHADAAAADSRLAVPRALDFLLESLSPFEMSHRGFQESNSELRRLNKEIEKRSVQLAAANDELRRQIEQRENLEAVLRQAQKMESIGTLAGGVAHDFNNLLTIIGTHAALATSAEAGAERRERSFAAIQSAARRGSSLVRQLLTFARKSDAHFLPLNLNALVEDLARMLRETLPRAVRISLELSPGMPLVTGDPDQIDQALLNLCLNARDAMPEGGDLRIATDVNDASGVAKRFSAAGGRELVRVTVTDTGVGMDEAMRERIFEPFFTTKHAGEGTGLGLAVVYGIAKSHGGFIDVVSEPGEGTAFSILFPAAGKEADADPRSEAPVAPGAGTATERCAETVLVIEDEAALVDAVRAILESEGFRVVAALDGPSAIDAFDREKGSVGVVLADLGLPGMSGWETLRRIWARNPAVRGILASGYLDPNLRKEIVSRGISGIVEKPYTVEGIVRAVRQAASVKSAGVQPQRPAGS